MARYYAPQLSIFPYHITGRCQNKAPFPISLEAVWKIFEEELFLSRLKYGLKIHAFVLMPNHFHLIASIGDTPLGVILRELMGNTSRRINELAGGINHLWGDNAHRSVVDNNQYFNTVYRYVYQNPRRAKLVARCEDWPFSTLHGLLGLGKMFIPVEEDTQLFDPEFELSTLEWLNCELEEDKIAIIRKGLKKKIFKVAKEYAGSDPLLK